MGTVMTAPLALVKFQNTYVLKATNISVNESINRQPIQGLGNLSKQELVPTSWMGTITCSLYLTEIGTPEIDAIRRRVSSTEEFVNQVLLNDKDGYRFDIFRKVQDAVDSETGKVSSTQRIFASITGAFPQQQSFSINEGQSGQTQYNFEFINPIIYPNGAIINP